jgi:hypothetical protein
VTTLQCNNSLTRINQRYVEICASLNPISGRLFLHCGKLRAFQCRFWKWAEDGSASVLEEKLQLAEQSEEEKDVASKVDEKEKKKIRREGTEEAMEEEETQDETVVCKCGVLAKKGK